MNKKLLIILSSLLFVHEQAFSMKRPLDDMNNDQDQQVAKKQKDNGSDSDQSYDSDSDQMDVVKGSDNDQNNHSNNDQMDVANDDEMEDFFINELSKMDTDENNHRDELIPLLTEEFDRIPYIHDGFQLLELDLGKTIAQILNNSKITVSEDDINYMTDKSVMLHKIVQHELDQIIVNRTINYLDTILEHAIKHNIDIDTITNPLFVYLRSYSFGSLFKKAINEKDLLLKVVGYNENNYNKSLNPRYFEVRKKIIDMLLDLGMDIQDETNDNSASPLTVAVINNYGQLAQYLITLGADINKQFFTNNNPEEDGFTALHYAVVNGNLLMVKLLVQAGADINKKDERDRTPLSAGISNSDVDNDFKVFNFLMTYPNSDINSKDFHGDTPLHHAVNREDWTIVTSLLKAGANFTIANNQDETPLRMAQRLYNELENDEKTGSSLPQIIQTLENAGNR